RALALREAAHRNRGVEDREAAAETHRAFGLARERPLAHALAIALEVIRVPALRRRQVELEIAIAALRLEKELEAGALPEFVRAALACERRRDERLRSLDPPAGPQPAGIRADDARLDLRNSRGGVIGLRHVLTRYH